MTFVEFCNEMWQRIVADGVVTYYEWIAYAFYVVIGICH